jgi:hypothetical protein
MARHFRSIEHCECVVKFDESLDQQQDEFSQQLSLGVRLPDVQVEVVSGPFKLHITNQPMLRSLAQQSEEKGPGGTESLHLHRKPCVE